MKMHENSLFAVLLRSPWWISFCVGAGLFGLTRTILPDISVLYPGFVALPFLVIGCVAGWRQLRAPSATKVAANLDALCALSWERFADRLEAAYRREGYEVRRISGAADLELEKSGRITLVAGRRWKVARTGVDPLRELEALRAQREAAEAVYMAGGEVTDTARAFAAKAGIRIADGAELARQFAIP